MTAGASVGRLLYSNSLSVEFMFISSSAVWRTIQFIISVRLSTDVSANPASPGIKHTL